MMPAEKSEKLLEPGHRSLTIKRQCELVGVSRSTHYHYSLKEPSEDESLRQAILRVYEKKPLIADQVAVNYRKADITPRQRAILDFAMKVCQRSHEVDDADFAALHAHGLDDEDIWDIAAITAFFGLSNRMASFSGMVPNPEFYLIGRLPKGQ